MSSVSSEDIYKCLCCLTAFKGVLDAPPDSEIVSPRPDLKQKYGNLEKGMSEANSWISRALVRRPLGDVAAVAWIHPVPQNGEFRLLFSNNNASASKKLNDDEKQARALLDKLEIMYEVQHNLLDDERALQKLQIQQTDALMTFVSDHSWELVARKMGALTRLSHYNVDDFAKDREELKAIFTTVIEVLACLPSRYVLDFSDGEKWLATYVGYAAGVNSEFIPVRAKLMQCVFNHILDMDQTARIGISQDTIKFRDFVRFCQEVRISPFMRGAHDDAHVMTEHELNIFNKLRRRLNRLISYRTGARAIVTDLFEYFRRASNGKETIKLTLDMVAKSLPDTKRTDGKFTEEPSEYLEGLVPPLPQDERQKLLGRLSGRLTSSGKNPMPWTTNQKVSVSYHAELRLVMYAVYVGLDLDIIGVSKLPCHSCFLFLQRLARLLQDDGKQVFWRFSGCSWKPHFRWGIPSSEMTGVERAPQDSRFELTDTTVSSIVAANYATQYALLREVALSYTDDDYPVSGTDSSKKGSDRDSV